MTEDLFSKYIFQVRAEYKRAITKWSPFNSRHEGYAVILEELEELWDAIKSDQPIEVCRKEAIQLATMAIRFCVDSNRMAKRRRKT